MNIEWSPGIEAELRELIDVMFDQELSAQQSQRLNELLEDDNAVDYYTRYANLHGVLAWRHRGTQLTAEVQNVASAAIPGVAQRPPERASHLWKYRTCIAAVCVLLLAGIAWMFSDPGTHPGEQFKSSVVTQEADGWSISPTGLAEFSFVEPGVIELQRGEIFVELVDGDAGPLTIKTPMGETTARKSTDPGSTTSELTRAYVGTHQPQENQPMFKPFTRVLILAGAVTFSNSLGMIEGSAGNLLYAEENVPPKNMAVQANNEFAFSLFRKLSEANDGTANQNLFFSPYSISNAMSILTEGARGKTAEQLGNVLGFPEELQRIGTDDQLIPWRMAQIHTGFAQQSDRLQNRDEDPQAAEIRERIKTLNKELKSHEFNYWWSRNSRDRIEGEKTVDQINELSRQLADYEISVANALWTNRDFPIRDSYVETINRFYKTGGAFSVDFDNDFKAARRQIAEWCSEQTQGKLSFDLGSLSLQQREQLQLIVTNAVYFRAGWSIPFKKSSTSSKPFTLADGSKVNVDMMYAVNVLNYGAFNADGSHFETPKEKTRGQKEGLYPDKGFHMIEMAYRGDELSMVMIAPTTARDVEGLGELLTPDAMDGWIRSMQSRKVVLRVPKFRMQTEYQLAEVFNKMGITDAFTVDANFSGLVDATQSEHSLMLSRIIHKSLVEVNEEGTEAVSFTAVTSDMTKVKERKSPFIPGFSADRPFVFAIRDMKTGTILFMGQMENPNK